MGVATEDDEVALQEQQSQDDDTLEGGDQGEAQGADQDDTIEGGDEGQGDQEDVISLGTEEPPASEEGKAAPEWVKGLRRENREKAKRIAELERQLSAGNTQAQGKPELPQKPKLADFNYDEEEFEQARDAWDAKKREVDAWEANQEKRAKAAQEAVKAVQDNYAKSKQALRVPDFQDAEDEVVGALSDVQQSILMAGASNPAVMVVALGKSPKKLQELASIKDPVKFAVAVGKLETEVKVTKRTSTKPAPEKTVRGSGSAAATSATLERLEAEAEKTGDRTKVVAWKAQQRKAGK